MTEREKSLDEPVLLSELRSLPRKYLRDDGQLNSAQVRLDLDILNDDDLKNALLALYRIDVSIATRVDERFVRALLAQLVGAPMPALLVPPPEESAWVAAEMACQACPGSQEAPVYVDGPILPLCRARARIERWESCMKFRENLFAAAKQGQEHHDESLAFAKAHGFVDDFEREVDAKIAEVSTMP